ncbi:hypothetical protein ACSRUE_38405 [Sorangium sp. KYC3313]|uniref:hypothetical protein n=1 Tax=Sorangium sp. KYC3313 TaxID=3449740 RepID=UPI003F8896CA
MNGAPTSRQLPTKSSLDPEKILSIPVKHSLDPEDKLSMPVKHSLDPEKTISIPVKHSLDPEKTLSMPVKHSLDPEKTLGSDDTPLGCDEDALGCDTSAGRQRRRRGCARRGKDENELLSSQMSGRTTALASQRTRSTTARDPSPIDARDKHLAGLQRLRRTAEMCRARARSAPCSDAAVGASARPVVARRTLVYEGQRRITSAPRSPGEDEVS